MTDIRLQQQQEFPLVWVWLWEVSSPGSSMLSRHFTFTTCYDPFERWFFVLYRTRMSKTMMLFISWQFMRYHLVTFSPFQFDSNAKWLSNGPLEFFGDVSCSCRKICINHCSQWVTISSWWPDLRSSSSRLLSLCRAKSLPCTFLAVPRPRAWLMLWAVPLLWPILNLNDRIAWVYFLSYMV